MNPIQIASCAILDEQERVLLLWRQEYHSYELPTGRVKPGESIAQAVRREVREDIGIDKIELATQLKPLRTAVNSTDLENHIIIAGIIDGVPRIMKPHKHERMLWMPIPAYLHQQLSPNTRIFCEEYMKY